MVLGEENGNRALNNGNREMTRVVSPNSDNVQGIPQSTDFQVLSSYILAYLYTSILAYFVFIFLLSDFTVSIGVNMVEK